ncbi:hypothetical protein OG780_19350 [Streptomyces sp. NBC_00386]|uniref:hypothetical protein n=1 Tax=Streptomyces sp. NBC_00386 TaxID=2975734 RepID=UPI002E1CE30D
MSPMWDNEPEYDAGICIACGRHTDDGVVRWLPRASGPDVRLIVHTRAQDCAAPPTEPVRAALRRTAP